MSNCRLNNLSVTNHAALLCILMLILVVWYRDAFEKSEHKQKLPNLDLPAEVGLSLMYADWLIRCSSSDGGRPCCY